jgi:carboxymethylenebutenolidase
VCAPFDASPPITPIAGAAITHRLTELVASDANRFAAFIAEPDAAPRAAVVILPDVRGLFGFYEELALRFAEHGITAITIDYFGRTAGVSRRDEHFPYADHVAKTTPDQVQRDVAAAAAALRDAPRTKRCAVFTVGFCFGGRHSWLAAASGHRLAGAVGFYGMPGTGRDGSHGPTQRAGEIQAPILALMGGADQAISAEQVAAFDAALTSADVDHDVVTYPDAPHSFFDRRFVDHAAASADAWQRVLAFIDQHAAV